MIRDWLYWPLLGFFGTQAVRLIRESWDGIVKVANNEVKPHGATELADELFAMFDDSIPQTQNAPVTINQVTQPGNFPVAPLTVNADPGTHGIVVNGGDLSLEKGANLTLGDLGSITTPALQVNGSMNLDGGFYFWNGVPLGLGKATGAGTTTFLGRVVSGSGATYLVDIYGNGSGMAATDRVTATAPEIDPGETIPAGFWIGAVHRFSNVIDNQTVITYEFQPPIWLS